MSEMLTNDTQFSQVGFHITDAIHVLGTMINCLEERLQKPLSYDEEAGLDISFWAGWYCARLDADMLPRLIKVVSVCQELDVDHLGPTPIPLDDSRIPSERRYALQHLMNKMRYLKEELHKIADKISGRTDIAQVSDEAQAFLAAIR